MRAEAFIFFALGMLVELILLGEHSLGRSSILATRHAWINRNVTAARAFIFGLVVLALILLLVVRVLGLEAELVYIDTPIINIFMLLLGLFVLSAAMAVKFFLPVVNEQTILVVQGLVLYSAFAGGKPVAWMPLAVLVSVPAVVSLGLILWRKPLHPSLKALLYLWYLVTLMVIPFQSNQVAYFRQGNLSLLDAATLGSLLVFLIIHGIFTVRFFLIVSSLLLPRNHVYVQRIMPLLFNDEQVPLGRLAITVLVLAAAILVNRVLGLVAEPVLLAVGMMFAVQFLSWRNNSQTV